MAKKTKAKKEDTPVVKKPKELSPFDIITMMFTNRDAFYKLSNYMLEKNFFMINRVMSIRYPIQAQEFNSLTANKAATVKAWQRLIEERIGYGKVPYFVYTRTTKKKVEETQEFSITKEDKTAYMDRYQMSEADYEDILRFSYDKAVAHIKKFIELNNPSTDIVTTIKNKKSK